MASKEKVKAAVGDLESKERGSAARFNDGKVPYQLLDISVVEASETGRPAYKSILECLAKWQHGGNSIDLLNAAGKLTALSRSMESVELEPPVFGCIAWDECARVFEYGAKKYCAWNWMKGQAWSIPFACCLRHLLKIYQGELIDSESKQTHLGHFLCNVMMLCYYEKEYPEGDDRPPFLANQ